ncbi:MAG: hypothetical protein IPJ54_18600 [Saprospiraceae bacterium]|nr:hypothetical protein [Saprospiraceae bacterium]
MEKKEIFSQFVNDFDRNKNVCFNINASERMNIKSDFLPNDLWGIL